MAVSLGEYNLDGAITEAYLRLGRLYGHTTENCWDHVTEARAESCLGGMWKARVFPSLSSHTVRVICGM
jgi:hypothetical protein